MFYSQITEEDVDAMTVSDLKALLKRENEPCSGCCCFFLRPYDVNLQRFYLFPF